MNLFAHVLRALVLLILPFLAWGYGRATLTVLRQASGAPARFIAFAIGAALFVPVWLFFYRRLGFFATMEHELTHLLVGLFFFKAPKTFHVTAEEGGAVHLAGSNFVIALAPYFLPTISYLLLPISLVLRREYETYLLALIGFTVAYHVFSTWHETSLRQPDIRGSGIIFSALFLPVANLIFYGGILAFVLDDFAGGARFWAQGFTNAYTIVSTLLGYR